MQPVLSNVRTFIELHCTIMLLSFPTKLVIGFSTIVDATVFIVCLLCTNYVPVLVATRDDYTCPLHISLSGIIPSRFTY